jgi:flavin reductase (DIM6/NTAB) family NADH-FMN oxidoreductase RutF
MTDPTTSRSLDASTFRTVLGHFPTGVVLVTGIGADGQPVGMAVGSFTSVSLDPPLVAFLPDRKSSTYPRLSASRTFVVNVLGCDHEWLCRRFAAKDVEDKWSGVAWRPAAFGAPILDGAVAWIECETETRHEAGDHYIVIGRVLDLESASTGLPLLFFQGGYGRFSPGTVVARPDAESMLPALRLVDLARREMEAVAADTGYECMAQTKLGREIVIVGSAAAPGGVATPSRVGLRLPFTAPHGVIFAAWAAPDVVAEWLAGAGNADAASEHRRMLARVRKRGWSVILAPLSDEVIAAMDAFAGEDDPSDKMIRLGQALDQAPGRHEPDAFGDGEVQDLRSLTAPVFGPDGHVVLALRLFHVPRVDPPTLDRLRARLSSAAEVVTRAVGATPDADTRVHPSRL